MRFYLKAVLLITGASLAAGDLTTNSRIVVPRVIIPVSDVGMQKQVEELASLDPKFKETGIPVTLTAKGGITTVAVSDNVLSMASLEAEAKEKFNEIRKQLSTKRLELLETPGLTATSVTTLKPSARLVEKDGKLVLTEFSNATLDAWDGFLKQLEPKYEKRGIKPSEDYPKTHKAMENFKASLNQLLSAGDSTEISQLAQNVEKSSAAATSSVLEATMTVSEKSMPSEENDRLKSLVMTLLQQVAAPVAIEGTLEGKGVYGLDDYILASELSRMVKQSGFVCRIKKNNGGTLGSGFAISDRICLTAWHVVSEIAEGGVASECRLIFPQSKKEKAEHRAGQILQLSTDAAKLDAALVILEKPLTEDDMTVGDPDDGSTPPSGYGLRLAKVPPASDIPLVVAGFREAATELSFVENCILHLPHIAKAPLRDRYANRELASRVVNWWFNNSQVTAAALAQFQREQEIKVREKLSEFFQNGDEYWRSYKVKSSAPLPKQPVFGIESDTFHGYSGSAVISKRSGEVVGLFTGGAPDYVTDPATRASVIATRAAASLEIHEFGIPITIIAAAIRKTTFSDAISY